MTTAKTTDQPDFRSVTKNKPSLRESLRALPFAIRYYYRISPVDTLALLGIAALSAPIAAGTMYAIKRVTDAVAGPTPTGAWTWVGVLVALFIADTLRDTVEGYFRARQDFRFEFNSSRDRMEILSSLPYRMLEDPDFVTLDIAYSRKAYQVRNIQNRLISVTRDCFSFLGYASAFAFLPTWLLLVIVATMAFRLWQMMRSAERTWSIFQSEAREGKRAEYIMARLSSPSTALISKMNEMSASFTRLWETLMGKVLKMKEADLAKYWRAAAVSRFVEDLGMSIGLAVAVGGVISGRAPVSSLVLFFTTFRSLTETSAQISGAVKNLLNEMLFLPVFKAFFTLEQESSEGIDLPSGRLTVAFEDVSFRYPGGTEDVLRGLTFSFSEGDHLALVGLNGAGKTTILRLLMRVYDPTQGRITVGGVDLRALRPAAWRRALAVMGQGNDWFEDSIRQEVLNGDLAAPEQADRLATAITTSGLTEVVSELPRGLDTVVGRRYAMPEDEAIELSGGQSQIVTIARTIYRDARVYVFDEPTSAVDAEKEERFFSNLPDALAGRALLFVSHRFSTLRRARRILVIDAGRLIEDGSHEELLAKQGRYAELFTLQAKMYQ